MSRRIVRPVDELRREGLTWQERWNGADWGLIAAWETGRDTRPRQPDLAECAERGELPPLGWKGGTDKKLKIKKKYGTLKYLATWQGLRSEPLDIDLDEEPELICSKTGLRVIFTSDINKFKNA